MSDGLLDTRREKARAFALKLGYSSAPVFVLALFLLVTGGGVVAAVAAVIGGLVALSIATSVRTSRGALWAGLTVAVGLLAALLALAWLVSHPIL